MDGKERFDERTCIICSTDGMIDRNQAEEEGTARSAGSVEGRMGDNSPSPTSLFNPVPFYQSGQYESTIPLDTILGLEKD